MITLPEIRGRLSPREWQIFRLIGCGLDYVEVAAALNITSSNVKSRVSGQIKEKLELEHISKTLIIQLYNRIEPEIIQRIINDTDKKSSSPRTSLRPVYDSIKAGGTGNGIDISNQHSQALFKLSDSIK